MITVRIVVFCLVAIFCLACTNSRDQAQDIVVVVTPPENFVPTDTVHIVGNFNGWVLEGERAVPLSYHDEKTNDRYTGKLVGKIQAEEENLFFHFVKNKNYQHMAASETGKSLCTYLTPIEPDTSTIDITIASWMGEASPEQAVHTLTGNIETIRGFDMPQLTRQEDIQVYLPPSYKSTEHAHRYPVLYMLDGQNIFDSYTAYGDEWRVDETLEDMVAEGQVPEIIVVAIPNGPRRWAEYNAWDFKSRDGKPALGEGEKTVAFIKDTLKPYIDKRYRTLPGRRKTGLAGSSLGGSLALYAAIDHGDTFGFVGAFSPGIDILNMDDKNVLLESLREKTALSNTRIYLDMGEVEYGRFDEIETVHAALLSAGAKASNVKLVKDKLGRHCEVDWSKRFPTAIQWLLLDPLEQ